MHYKFHKVYIELTNICGLSCSFCPTKDVSSQTISLELFEKILLQLQPFTKDIAFHVFGDPLALSNLENYLDISYKYKFKVHITTTGYYLNKFKPELFLHKAIKQINFSLNSYNKNEMKISLEEYLEPMFKLCDLKLKNKIHNFINFRLWNLDENNSENSFNSKVFTILSKKFNINLSKINFDKPIRLENQILIDFDKYFKWPSLNDTEHSNGYCHGLSSQIAILSSGTVVPCCLDSFGCINLGNLNDKSLKDILNSKRSTDIVNGFKNNLAVEELCKKCTFKNRFNK
ncbi:MAG: radical SAM/SPASM domain-containing protein, partial [Campylobacterota bacterium]|nr:radical SAM/SPASM domain-containing protein [Campylobacterota bacterium]